MLKRKKTSKLTTLVDESIKLSEKEGNGILRLLVKVNDKNEVDRYSLAYINTRICQADNGRILGYDNSHGYHHRHYMGTEETIEYQSYQKIAEQFEREWRALHEKAKKA